MNTHAPPPAVPASMPRDPAWSDGAEPEVLRLEGVRVRSGNKAPSEPIDLVLRRGELVAIDSSSQGLANGLLRVCAGLDEPAGGRVTVLGSALDTLDAHARLKLRRDVGYVPLSGALLSNLRLEANVALPLRYHRPGTDHVGALARICNELGLPDGLPATIPPFADRSVLRLAAFARAVLLEPPLLLLDEPVQGATKTHGDAIWRVLEQLRVTKGIACIVWSESRPVPQHAQRLRIRRSQRLTRGPAAGDGGPP